MNSLVNYLTGRSEKSSKKNNIIVVNEDEIQNNINDIINNDIEPVITISKFNKNINEITKNTDDEDEESINNEESTDNEDNTDNEDSESDIDKLNNEFETNFIPDNFKNYIIPESVQPYTKNAEFCKFNWNGIEFLDKWELQRKVDTKHATELAKSLKADHKKYGEFIFYDPIHIGKKVNDDKYYVLDGQHRLEAYQYFYERNIYPIQQIPGIIWYSTNEEHFIELFHKINSRLSIDKLKLIQIKLLEIFEGMEKKYGRNIWGINRPKINKDMFSQKLRNSDFVHKSSTEEILNKLFKINENLRKMPRASRVKPNCVTSIHNSAETMDFFLGLDKVMGWIVEI
jgi:hypothetical protein